MSLPVPDLSLHSLCTLSHHRFTLPHLVQLPCLQASQDLSNPACLTQSSAFASARRNLPIASCNFSPSTARSFFFCARVSFACARSRASCRESREGGTDRPGRCGKPNPAGSPARQPRLPSTSTWSPRRPFSHSRVHPRSARVAHSARRDCLTTRCLPPVSTARSVPKPRSAKSPAPCSFPPLSRWIPFAYRAIAHPSTIPLVNLPFPHSPRRSRPAIARCSRRVRVEHSRSALSANCIIPRGSSCPARVARSRAPRRRRLGRSEVSG